MDLDTVVALAPNPRIQEFRPGDTVKVNIRIKEGDRERLQAFQGTVIRSRGRGGRLHVHREAGFLRHRR